MGKVTLRTGSELLYFASPSDAARYQSAMLLARQEQCPSGEGGASVGVMQSSDGILQVVAEAAEAIHGLFVEAMPSLHGQAATSLGTALRSRLVRQALQGASVRALIS